MFKSLFLAAMASAFALAPLSAALAAADCPKYPKAEWMPEADMKKKITDAGYVIDKFKVSGECYEIYGKDKDGNKVEIYYDAKTGEPVKTHVKKK